MKHESKQPHAFRFARQEFRDQPPQEDGFLRQITARDICARSIDPSLSEGCINRIKNGVDMAIARAVAYAPYADLLWCETSTPDIEDARRFAEGVHAKFPGKLLAYNCSPSFNWAKKLSPEEISNFRNELARQYRDEGMTAYSRLQEAEFAAEKNGYTATKHQREVGTGYFDQVLMAVSNGQASTGALKGSTEEAQFNNEKAIPTGIGKL